MTIDHGEMDGDIFIYFLYLRQIHTTTSTLVLELKSFKNGKIVAGMTYKHSIETDCIPIPANVPVLSPPCLHSDCII